MERIADAHRGSWRTYTTTDGLAGLQTEHLVQDAEGFLWIGTWNSGVSRYDGDLFQNYARSEDGLCGNQVMAIHRDDHDRLWFGTLDGGLCYFEDGQFHRCAGPEALCRGAITFIVADRSGRLWFGGVGVLGYWEEGAFFDLTPLYSATFGAPPSARMPNQCWGIAQGNSGDMWFGFDYLVHFDGTRFSRFGQEDGLPRPGNGYAVATDAEGTLWLGGQRCFGPFDGRAFAPATEEFQGAVRKIQVDATGTLWICTTGSGVFQQTAENFRQLVPTDGLGFNMVNGMLQDHEGQIWFATWGGGISRCDPLGLQLYSDNKALRSSDCTAMLVDAQNRLWLNHYTFLRGSLEQHLSHCTQGQWQAVDADTVLALGGCKAMCETADGLLWFGGPRGLLRYDGAVFAPVDLPLGSSPYIDTLAADGDAICLGHFTDDGQLLASRYSGDSLQTLYRDEQNIDDGASITAIVRADDGAFWFGVGSVNGLGRGRGLRRVVEGALPTSYTMADGLPDDTVQDLAFDHQGALWIATLGGACRFDGRQFEAFTTADGLPNNHVWCVFVDRSGCVWLCTDGGVARYDGRDLLPLRAPDIGPTKSGIEDQNGTFWFATLHGLVAYWPVRSKPRVRIVQSLADGVHSDPQAIELSTATGQVLIEYKGLSFRTHPKDLFYRYRLRGHDDWQGPTTEGRALYAHLAPGEYVFEVKATDRDANESDPAQLDLRVVPDAREDRIEALEEALSLSHGMDSFSGQSAAMRRVLDQLSTIAESGLTTLILGETGVGKGLAARALHEMSERRDAPFIQVNCGALPEGLVESELFGHEKGAFTGAASRKIGRFELAHGGTLFLDEIGDMPLAAQRALLQVLQDSTLQRLGGGRAIRVDVRVVAATNRDLTAAIAAGQFRADLFYRLNGYALELPSLRQRREDIPLLIEHFATRFARHLHRPVPRVDEGAMARLMEYTWPGNVRELEHMIQRAVLTCADDLIRSTDLASSLALDPSAAAPEAEDALISLEQYDEQAGQREKRYLERVLEQTRWRVAGRGGAAELLAIHPDKLRARMKKYGLRRSKNG